jgi:hypothetical protein
MQHRAAPDQPPGPAPGLSAGLDPVLSAGLDPVLASGLGAVAAGLGEELGDGLSEGLGDGLSEGLGDGLSEGLGDGLGDGLGEGLGDGLGEGAGVGQADRLGLAIGLALGDGLALAFALGQALGLGHGPGLAAAGVAQWAGAALLWCFLPGAAPARGAAPPGCVPPPLTAGPPVPTAGPPPSTVWISATACAYTCWGNGVNAKTAAIAMKAARASTATGRHAGCCRPDRAARYRSRAVPGACCSHSHAVCSPPRARPVTWESPVMIQATGVECGTVSRARIRSRPSSAGLIASASACSRRRSSSP